jgi:hypothetical protein
MLTLHLRPASLQLPQIPCAIYSAPDGSCVLVVQDEGGKRTTTAYHWSTFASTPGVTVTLPDFPVDLDAALLTSILNKNNIHLVGLDIDNQPCRSIVLGTIRKPTEFKFEERWSKGSSGQGKQTVHNCLIYLFIYFGSIYIPAYSSVNKPGRSYEPLHLRTYLRGAPSQKTEQREREEVYIRGSRFGAPIIQSRVIRREG